jgi:succinyl-diaminopimelate desuccinylase
MKCEDGAPMEQAGLLKKLIQIDSQNPPGNTEKIIAFIKQYLGDLRVKSRIFEFKKGYLNLVCEIKSLNSRKKILLTPHIDTVPVTGKWRFPPLSGEIAGDKIFGRGASDCKINVAACLELIRLLRTGKILLDNLDLVFAFCCDEEAGSYWGTIPLVKKLKNIDYGLVLDSDEFDIITAQKGLLHLRVELVGKEAHGAYPERGINAVEKGVGILKEIMDQAFLEEPGKTDDLTLMSLRDDFKRTTVNGFSYRRHPLLKKPTLNVGRFGGGDRVNVVAGEAYFELDFRYLPGMRKEDIIATVERLIRKYKIPYRLKILAWQDAIEVEKDLISLVTLKKILKKHKIAPRLKASFGATVINFLQDRNIKSFAFGFGSSGTAHTKNEYARLSQLKKGAVVLLDYVRTLDQRVA